MAAAAAFLTYLLALSMVDEISLNLASVQKLVDYQYSFNFTELVPGMLYNTSVNATFAVPPSALAGLVGRRVAVKVSGIAENESEVYFLSPYGSPSKQAEAYLYCDVAGSGCANTSVLFAVFPLSVSVRSGEAQSTKLVFRSELADSIPLLPAQDLQKPASDLLEAFRKTFTGSSNATAQPGSSLFPNESSNNSSENFLDTLRPEGDSQNPLDYLRQNPIISIAALAIVVVITGAYLLNAKD